MGGSSRPAAALDAILEADELGVPGMGALEIAVPDTLVTKECK